MFSWMFLCHTVWLSKCIHLCLLVTLSWYYNHTDALIYNDNISDVIPGSIAFIFGGVFGIAINIVTPTTDTNSTRSRLNNFSL